VPASDTHHPVDISDATDTKRLDWLAAQSMRGLRWVARKSVTGRGYRLHQSEMIGEAMGDTPRQAIDYAMRSDMNSQRQDGK